MPSQFIPLYSLFIYNKIKTCFQNSTVLKTISIWVYNWWLCLCVCMRSSLSFLMFCWPSIMIYSYNKNQQDAIFTFNLFQKLTSACFKQVCCSSSRSTTLYTVYTAIGNINAWHIPVAVYTVHRVVLCDDEQ